MSLVPTNRMIFLVASTTPFFIGGAWIGGLTGLGVIYCLALILWAILDALMLPRKSGFKLERTSPSRLSLGVPCRLELVMESLIRRPVDVTVAEHFPPQLVPDEQVLSFRIGPREKKRLEYRVSGRERGQWELGEMDVRIQPRFGLFARQFRASLPATVQVFPNLVEVRKYELLIRRGLSAEQGLARLRRQGQGSEFESLRAYLDGDDLSRVDWKATARRGKPLVREFQPERRQNIVVAIDVGRGTLGEFDGLSRLDYFVNSALMLAWVVLRQGDWFSLVAFSDRIESYLPPVRGLGKLESVALALYNLKPRQVESDYTAACRFMGLKTRKRSLICLMTEVLDSTVNDILIAYLGRFARRHLPLVVTLVDTEIQSLADAPLATAEDVFEKAVAIDLFRARREALAQMRRYGVSVLDVPPRSLTPDLLNRFLEIKAAGKL